MGKSKASKKRAKDVANDVNAAEVAMAKAVQSLQEIFREHSEQEIRAALLECNMNQNFAIDRLLSQQGFFFLLWLTQQLFISFWKDPKEQLSSSLLCDFLSIK